MNQTTARLRKTFQYPAEDDEEEDLPEALDEEEQDQLIRTLHRENNVRNQQFTYILCAIPVLCIVPYLLTLFSPPSTLLSLLSITSLLSTLYLLLSLPPGITSLPFLDNLHSPLPTTNTTSPPQQPSGPIAQYLPLLNLALSLVLGLLGTVSSSRKGLWWGFGWVPGLVYGFVLMAKVVMAGVDPEEELGRLRYGFKGA